MKPSNLPWAPIDRFAFPATCGFILAVCLLIPRLGLAQKEAGPKEPGEHMIEEYLRAQTEQIETNFSASIKTLNDWQELLPRYRQEFLDMLGLWPLPAKEPLRATVTRTLDRGEYVVEMLHYQSRPGLYVTGNLYRPARMEAGQRLPAIFYVCGHAPRGRNGNKTAYQANGIWFAKHGYICLMVDTVQLGEIAGIHHGTYREGRWWWLSRGYTPAGVECWNGIRGIDYLTSRPDVDPERIGVTGISGGGSATFWIAAADKRVKVAVPISGMSDLTSYVSDHIVNEHCDCMFLYNTYQWPWTRIPALIAPRPLLFVNSDQDGIFPMDGNERVINRLERVYSLFGAGDLVDSLVSIGGHAYRKDIRQGVDRFLDTYLKTDPRTVVDTEVDLVTGNGDSEHPISPEQLRVFPHERDLPNDARNGRIDEEFVPMGKPELPNEGDFETWKKERMVRLRTLTFHHFPNRLAPARAVETNSTGALRLETEQGISVDLRPLMPRSETTHRVWIIAAGPSDEQPTWWTQYVGEQDAVYLCQPRGVGETRWTTKNPPNYVERAHYLLGRTVDSGRVWDLASVARFLKASGPATTSIYLAGQGAAGVLCAYSALLEPDVAGVILFEPPASHMDSSAPSLLNVLRVCDVPQALGMLAPRPITVVGGKQDWCKVTAAIYQAAHAMDKFVVK